MNIDINVNICNFCTIFKVARCTEEAGIIEAAVRELLRPLRVVSEVNKL